ncbi:glycosyltransferase family 2 protein [Aurantiacibacter aquimixticola]|uniref:Glycosyltransferase family 2 protein n=1 Tax=Aurantiacibacter aquimixticola TaxID=1958945 RepID=A0A419RUK9_9SPHN|nr:glycosyltransferase family 2 protein [Aurantiacibacter aquimixticola]RJY09460.1 glycosyltransferase family 2 protein [Aurantiacibacter aquimixticola]
MTGEATDSRGGSAVPKVDHDKPDISVFVVGYNSSGFIEECIDALNAACAAHTFEILLIDNGDLSTEALVRERFPYVSIVESRGNIGFAAANNVLAGRARADLYFLLNPDLFLAPKAIDILIEAARDRPSISAFGGVSFDPAGKADTGNNLSIPSLGGHFRYAIGHAGASSREGTSFAADMVVPVLMGGMALIRKSAWKEVDGFDERYFLYCEEVDLFFRLSEGGHAFMRIAAAKAVHYAGHGRALSTRRQLFRISGIMEFARHHWAAPAVFLSAILIWTGAAIRVGIGLLFGRRNARWLAVGKANRVIAGKPWLWWRGYHPKKGLLAKLSLHR